MRFLPFMCFLRQHNGVIYIHTYIYIYIYVCVCVCVQSTPSASIPLSCHAFSMRALSSKTSAENSALHPKPPRSNCLSNPAAVHAWNCLNGKNTEIKKSIKKSKIRIIQHHDLLSICATDGWKQIKFLQKH